MSWFLWLWKTWTIQKMRLLTSLVGYERKKEKRKILEVGPSKATQPTSSMLQKLLATQSALLDTTPQAAPHDKIDVPGLCPRGNLHLHKTSPISTKEVGKILNQHSSFTITESSFIRYRCYFPCYWANYHGGSCPVRLELYCKCSHRSSCKGCSDSSCYLRTGWKSDYRNGTMTNRACFLYFFLKIL